ncbi:MAG: hypothetical protein NVS1B16_12630 [Pseudarthrobacter sp.]
MEPRTRPSRSSTKGTGPGRRSSLGMGVLAGFIGLGCCVYPVVLVLIGAASVSAAVGLGEHLYSSWGWAFKSAAVVFAAGAIAIQRRRRQGCPADRRGSGRRAVLWLVGSGLATYLVLYVVTRALAGSST